jgi:hypothetical protein
MYIAQKILKSMSSITNDIREENNDFDELIFTPKSARISSILTQTMSDRQPSLIPPTDENFTIDSTPSNISNELQTDTINGIFILKIKNFSTISYRYY